jgi:spermidine/putrescine transport system ATP-binding protein
MADQSATPDVELRDVTKRFGDVVAVDDISLQIEQGEFFSLLGPSGCGKTTTLRMVGGFIEPTEGMIYIKGNVSNGVPAYRRDTNMVFQQLALFPHMDVYDNIAFGPMVKSWDKQETSKRVREVLELVDLSGYEDRRIQQLSGGQQQRVAIARALINEPSVLLLDEPLGALDLKLRLQMQIELKRIQQRVGTTFIYVTHDQGEALTMSDRIAVMNQGRIEQVGSSEAIYSRPLTRFVARFIGDTNLVDGKVVGVEEDMVVVESRGTRIYAARDAATPSEGAVTLSIRPEKINIEAESGSNNLYNAFTGRVKTVTFMGSILRYEVVLENGIELLVEESNQSGVRLSESDQINLSWSNESNVVLSEG